MKAILGDFLGCRVFYNDINGSIKALVFTMAFCVLFMISTVEAEKIA